MFLIVFSQSTLEARTQHTFQFSWILEFLQKIYTHPRLFYINSSTKTVWNFVFDQFYLCCHFIMSIKSGIIIKLVHFLFWQRPIFKDHAFVGQKFGWGLMKNVPNFLPIGKQFICSSVGIDSVVLGCWRLAN